jgi:hypothetical protein
MVRLDNHGLRSVRIGKMADVGRMNTLGFRLRLTDSHSKQIVEQLHRYAEALYRSDARDSGNIERR